MLRLIKSQTKIFMFLLYYGVKLKGKNNMTVGAVNNNQQQTYAVPAMAAGLATGAIAGGTYGYLSKPWLKDGDITDTFVKEADKKITNMYKDGNKQIVDDLKKMQETGSIEGVSEVFRYTFKDDGLTTMTAEQRKAFVKKFLQENGVENLDELLKNMNTFTDEVSVNGMTKSAKKFKILSTDMSLEDLNKLLKDKGFDQVFGTATKENKTQIIEFLQTLHDEAIQGTILVRKASILEHVDVKKKSMKDLAANADYETKSIYNAIKKAIRNTNLKAGAKWGAIGAGVLGAVGLGVGALNNKKS